MAGTMAGVATARPDFLISDAPVQQLRFGEGTVSLECRTEYDRRHLGLRVKRACAAIALRDRGAGKQKRRHGNKDSSHSSLDIDNGRSNAHGQRTLEAPADLVRRQRARGGRSRPSGWTPSGGNCEKRYGALDVIDAIEIPAAPAMEAEAQHAVHGPQCVVSLSCLAPSSLCECAAWSWPAAASACP